MIEAERIMCMYDMDAFTCGFNAGTQEAKKELSEAHRQKIVKGIEEAKKRGVRLGRPPKVRPKDFERIKAAWMHKEISSRMAAKKLGISQDTFLRWCRSEADEEMKINESLSILQELRNRLVCGLNVDTEDTEKVIKAIEIIDKYITQNAKPSENKLCRMKYSSGRRR